MKRFFKLLALTAIFLPTAVSADALEYKKAFEEVLPWPVVQQGLNVQQAYQLQKNWMELYLDGAHPVAFKRGLTTEQALQQFGLDAPVTGVFPAVSRQVATSTEKVRLSKQSFIKPMIEIELGIAMALPATEPFDTLEAFLESAMAFKLMVELPDLGFQARPSGIDVISSNVAARYYIERAGMCMDMEKIEEIPVSLYFNEEKLFESRSGDILGGQLNAAWKMANQLIEQGWSLRPGQVLLTGSIGPMIPGKVGEYRADFGELGEIRFEITE